MTQIIAAVTILNVLTAIGCFFWARQAQICAERAHAYEQNCFKRWLESGVLDDKDGAP